MYSQPWSPTPSTTAVTPLFRTAKRSPAMPRQKTSPPVAPYKDTFPTMMFSSGTNVDARGGYTTMKFELVGHLLYLGGAARAPR